MAKYSMFIDSKKIVVVCPTGTKVAIKKNNIKLKTQFLNFCFINEEGGTYF